MQVLHYPANWVDCRLAVGETLGIDQSLMTRVVILVRVSERDEFRVKFPSSEASAATRKYRPRVDASARRPTGCCTSKHDAIQDGIHHDQADIRHNDKAWPGA